MTLLTTIRSGFRAELAGVADLGANRFDLAFPSEVTLPSGVASGFADLLFADQRTLAASATENLDLAGSLTDPLGAVLTFVKVKGIYIKAAAANTNNVLVGGAAATQLTGLFSNVNDVIVIPPGGHFQWYSPAGIAVGAGSTDLLKIANSAGSTGVTYDIAIIGSSS